MLYGPFQDFTDILSAALDVSGITGEDDFDFDFSGSSGQIPASSYGSLPVPSAVSVPATVQVCKLKVLTSVGGEPANAACGPSTATSDVLNHYTTKF